MEHYDKVTFSSWIDGFRSLPTKIKSKDEWSIFCRRIIPLTPWIVIGVIVLILVLCGVPPLPVTHRLVFNWPEKDGDKESGWKNHIKDPNLQLVLDRQTKPTNFADDTLNFDKSSMYPFDPEMESVTIKACAAIIAVPYLLPLVMLRPVAFLYHFTSLLVAQGTYFVLGDRFGALRPNFYDQVLYCRREHKDDEKKRKECEEKNEKDARRSFPSGHSTGICASYIFAGLDWIALLAATWNQPRITFSIVWIVPLSVIFWVVSTRYTDYYHNLHDILGGMLLGTTCACFFFYGYCAVIREKGGTASKSLKDEKDSDI